MLCFFSIFVPSAGDPESSSRNGLHWPLAAPLKFAAGKSRGSKTEPKSYEIKKRKSDRAGPLFWSTFYTKTF